MAYATVEAFVEVVGLVEAKALAPATLPATGHDEAKILRALDDASAKIDTYVGGRYPTPLSPVPRVIEVATISLAREALDRQGRDQVVKEADRVRAWLRDVSKGTAILAGNEADQDAPAAAEAGGAQFAAPDRVFDDSGLANFLGGCR